jgi:acyl carrier protein
MDRDQVTELVMAAVHLVLDDEALELTAATALAALDMDSIDLLIMDYHLTEEFRVEVNTRCDLMPTATVGAVVDYIIYIKERQCATSPTTST